MDTTKIHCEKFGLVFPDEFWERMDVFAELILANNEIFGLISSTDEKNLWQRHIIDSLTPLFAHKPQPGLECLDIGSGGGFPGIVLASALPENYFILVECNPRKASFLSNVTKALSLKNATVYAKRVEEIPGKFEWITLRATGPLTRTFDIGCRKLLTNGTIIVWAGPKFEDKIDYWQKFAQKRDAQIILWRYPENWVPDTSLYLAVCRKCESQPSF